MHITRGRGYKMKPVSQNAEMENEFLIKHSTTFRIKSIKSDGTYTHVYVEQE